MKDINKFYVIYDFITPAGYIPFTYEKEELPKLLKTSMIGELKIKDKYPNHKKILTNHLTPQLLSDNSNTFLVVVKTKSKSILDGINLNKVISKKLKNYIEIFDNFEIIKS